MVRASYGGTQRRQPFPSRACVDNLVAWLLHVLVGCTFMNSLRSSHLLLFFWVIFSLFLFFFPEDTVAFEFKT